MLRSLFSAISGMRSQQMMMDVTGNNIANVNTTGYKSSTTVFQDTLSQLVKTSGGPQATRGGSNPAQVGLGVQLNGISQSFGQGSAQTTGSATDLMINGDGLFAVRVDGQQLFTRAGAFKADGSGQLVTADGGVVQGWMATGGVVNTGGPLTDLRIPNDPTLQSYTITPDGTIMGTFTGDRKEPIGQVALANFANPNGLEKTGATMWRTTVNSGAAQLGVAGTGGRGTISSGQLEMSNVDLAQEFTNLIIAQRGFQANSRVITASDEVLQDLVNIKR